MASNAGIFFAGMGTTLIILGTGFGGGAHDGHISLEGTDRVSS
jgi:hypothetical protein